MPPAEQAYEELTPQLVVMLDMVVEQRTRKEIADWAGVTESAIRDRLLRLEAITESGDQRELARWWLAHKKPWLLWLLAQLKVDPQELVR
ncbi:MAG: hypothetical protein KC482_05190 [Dehalococcoidia bacterium]|nr:hypothetical protein [Dehalococcoidia bacterium]MCA9845373.1 hypothetical protein [Dehalococcoidia bacterium]MCA9852980.1 hypothetical protein [Dehalococcoidia bacterium]